MGTRLGVKATTLKGKAKDLAFKAKSKDLALADRLEPLARL